MLRNTTRLIPRMIATNARVPTRFASTSTTTPIVVTATGPDKVGIMANLTGVVVSHQGNVQAGRMTKLGGHFCVMMLVQVPEGNLSPLDESLKKLDGLTVVTHKTVVGANAERSRHRIVKLSGADSLGILNKITDYFAQNNISVDDMNTASELAPFSATPIFRMQATVSVPSSFTAAKLDADLGVDVWVESYYI